LRSTGFHIARGTADQKWKREREIKVGGVEDSGAHNCKKKKAPGAAGVQTKLNKTGNGGSLCKWRGEKSYIGVTSRGRFALIRKGGKSEEKAKFENFRAFSKIGALRQWFVRKCRRDSGKQGKLVDVA